MQSEAFKKFLDKHIETNPLRKDIIRDVYLKFLNSALTGLLASKNDYKGGFSHRIRYICCETAEELTMEYIDDFYPRSED